MKIDSKRKKKNEKNSICSGSLHFCTGCNHDANDRRKQLWNLRRELWFDIESSISFLGIVICLWLSSNFQEKKQTLYAMSLRVNRTWYNRGSHQLASLSESTKEMQALTELTNSMEPNTLGGCFLRLKGFNGSVLPHEGVRHEMMSKDL
jgi:hypothetical protein